MSSTFVVTMVAGSFCVGCLMACLGVFLITKRMIRRERRRVDAALRVMNKGHLLRVIDNEKEAG